MMSKKFNKKIYIIQISVATVLSYICFLFEIISLTHFSMYFIVFGHLVGF